MASERGNSKRIIRSDYWLSAGMNWRDGNSAGGNVPFGLEFTE